MDDTIIPETSLIKVLGFKFDSLLTCEPQISDILGSAKQRAGSVGGNALHNNYYFCGNITKYAVKTGNISYLQM